MKKLFYFTLTLLAAASISAEASRLERKASDRLWVSYCRSTNDERLVCWIKFRDKGGEKQFPILHANAGKRRTKIGRALSYGDLPVNAGYLRSVRESGGQIRTVSPWLNSVSGRFTKQQLDNIAALSCVEQMDLVPTFTAPSIEITEAGTKTKAVSGLDYGYDSLQIKLLRINELHDLGYTGAGVRLAFIDTGFDRWHQVFSGINIVGERDFQRMVITRIDTIVQEPLTTDTVWGFDSVTSFEPEQDISRQQTQHGTGMLSIAGANLPGTMIGGAFNADFILAKTEWLFGSDFYQEEDWWIAGLQWAADTMGADIVSSSLAYRQWSDHPSYTYPQMNGEYARCTAAAESAVSRGVIILNALGNVSSNTRPDTCIVAPADAKSVISVGGVWPTTRQWANPTVGSGTAAGPTSDSVKIQRFGGIDSLWIRRIKPDIASAWQNAFANNMDTINYSQILNGSGTSGATALAAGLCALLLEAHPGWGPDDMMNALKSSGSNRATADTFLAHPESLSTELGANPNYNPAFSGIANGHKYYIDNAATVYDFYDVYRIGWGIPDGVAALNYTGVENLPPDNKISAGFKLFPNAPNPVGNETNISYRLPKRSRVSLSIYNIMGQPVRELDLGIRPQGTHIVKWNGCDANGSKVSSGVYLYRLSATPINNKGGSALGGVAGEFRATGKMLVIR
jgi:serine protease AprX